MIKSKLMKNIKFYTLLIAILGFTSTSFAQSSATLSNNSVGATIHLPITLSNTTALNFGGVVSSVSGGTVVLNAGTSVRTVTGVTIPAGLAGTVAAGLFTVSGHKSAQYSITIPSAPVTITLSAGKTMTVGNFTSTKTSGTISATTGTDTFSVGATLNVGANQDPGLYTGTYVVTVAYQ